MKNLLSFFKIIQYLVITVLLIGILAFVVYLFVPSPSKTIRTFFIALRLQNYQKAYELIDGQYLKIEEVLRPFPKIIPKLSNPVPEQKILGYYRFPIGPSRVKKVKKLWKYKLLFCLTVKLPRHMEPMSWRIYPLKVGGL